MSDALISQYDGLVCDLDGVVYAGPSAVPHAVDSLSAASGGGVKIVYATNNASRPPARVATHLRELGLVLDDGDVVNSSMAAAYVLREVVEPGASVLAIGGEGVKLALTEGGFVPIVPTSQAAREVAAVVQGYGPDVTAQHLAEAAYAIQAGARWIATNTDRTLPTDRGTAPGNGSLVAAVRCAVDIDPQVAGKPMPVMYDMASERMDVQADRVLAIGDRLETDVEGAGRGGYDSVLVLTGVHTLADAAAASGPRRPTYVLQDLRGLAQPYEVVPPASSNEHPEQLSLAEARGALLRLWDDVDAGRISSTQARAAVENISVAADG